MEALQTSWHPLQSTQWQYTAWLQFGLPLEPMFLRRTLSFVCSASTKESVINVGVLWKQRLKQCPSAMNDQWIKDFLAKRRETNEFLSKLCWFCLQLKWAEIAAYECSHLTAGSWSFFSIYIRPTNLEHRDKTRSEMRSFIIKRMWYLSCDVQPVNTSLDFNIKFKSMESRFILEGAAELWKPDSYSLTPRCQFYLFYWHRIARIWHDNLFNTSLSLIFLLLAPRGSQSLYVNWADILTGVGINCLWADQR